MENAKPDVHAAPDKITAATRNPVSSAMKEILTNQSG
jgi:hypothetical protein